MSLLLVSEFEICEGKKLSLNSPVTREAFRRMRNRNDFEIENHEKVFDPFKFLLYAYESVIDKNEYRCNANAEEVDKCKLAEKELKRELNKYRK